MNRNWGLAVIWNRICLGIIDVAEIVVNGLNAENRMGDS